MKDYEQRREERRKEARDYHSEVAYAVWQSGGDMDRVDRDRSSDYHQQGLDAHHAARLELQMQRPPREFEELEDPEQS